MATKLSNGTKITFGTRRLGKHAKRTGPKATPTKPYRAQG